MTQKKIVASIEARMTSTRLPGKVLLPCVGKKMLELLVERVKRSKIIDEIVISTTVNTPDDEIVKVAKRLGIGYFRGSELDVVERVVFAMKYARADVVVQLTGDCPLLDPDVIDQVTRIYLYNNFDYVSNTLVRSYPRGLDVQVSSFEILEKSLRIAKDDAQHEHLFLSIYENSDKFRLFNVFANPELCRPDYRWTLDTGSDYDFINTIYRHFYKKNPTFTSSHIIGFIKKYPEVAEINNDIQQKPVR